MMTQWHEILPKRIVLKSTCTTQFFHRTVHPWCEEKSVKAVTIVIQLSMTWTCLPVTFVLMVSISFLHTIASWCSGWLIAEQSKRRKYNDFLQRFCFSLSHKQPVSSPLDKSSKSSKEIKIKQTSQKMVLIFCGSDNVVCITHLWKSWAVQISWLDTRWWLNGTKFYHAIKHLLNIIVSQSNLFFF